MGSRALAQTSSVEPCEKCHSSSAWEFAAFNHSKTGFLLKGKHQAVLCRRCHESGAYEKRIDQTCRACHQDIHAGQLGMNCEKCHDENSWIGNFGPEAHRRTNFPLTGRHALIPCEECHMEKREKTFSRAALECYACHQTDYLATASRSLDHVAFGFGTNCRDCHHPTRWRPATFPGHNSCFPITRGPHSKFACLECHSSLAGITVSGACSTGTFFCGNCHTSAHSQSKMDDKHKSVAGYQYKDQKCYSCHHANN